MEKDPNLEQYLLNYQKMENIINELKNGNTEQAVCLTLKLFDIDQNIIMYNYDVIHLVYIFSAQHDNNPKEYFDYLILLNQKEEEKFQVHFNIIKSFALFLRQLGTKKSDFLLEYMFEHKMADPIIVQYLHSFYFAHYNFKSTINQYLPYEFDIDKLKANDWVLHKTLVHEGFTQNEIMEIIRNDDVNKLQEISSQAGFKLNQEITYSYFDIYFHEIDYNHDSAKVTLIDYAAFFGSIKCFKYLLMNGADVSNSGKYAIASGNLEIVHLCEQNHSSFEYAYETAIQFHRNDIFNYLYENKLEELNHLTKLGIKCIEYYNYQILSFLESKGMTVDSELITKLAENGNLFFMKYFIKKVEMPKNILESAVKSGNIELVKFILQQKDINKNEDRSYI